jgi:hypothetical protein
MYGRTRRSNSIAMRTAMATGSQGDRPILRHLDLYNLPMPVVIDSHVVQRRHASRQALACALTIRVAALHCTTTLQF